MNKSLAWAHQAASDLKAPQDYFLIPWSTSQPRPRVFNSSASKHFTGGGSLGALHEPAAPPRQCPFFTFQYLCVDSWQLAVKTRGTCARESHQWTFCYGSGVNGMTAVAVVSSYILYWVNKVTLQSYSSNPGVVLHIQRSTERGGAAFVSANSLTLGNPTRWRRPTV